VQVCISRPRDPVSIPCQSAYDALDAIPHPFDYPRVTLG
jgi:hypothetical protein